MLSPKCRRSLGRIGWLLIGTASVVLWSRNTLAKLAIEQVGSFALGIPISVDKISIHFHQIELTNIRLWESAIRVDTQLAIESIRIAPTFLRGISSGAWVRLLVVDQPSLLLRFDSHGTLLSKFPNVVAITNPIGPVDGLLDFASSPILLATPAPVALIAKANEALKDRTIHVQVGGTTNRPARAD